MAEPGGGLGQPVAARASNSEGASPCAACPPNPARETAEHSRKGDNPGGGAPSAQGRTPLPRGPQRLFWPMRDSSKGWAAATATALGASSSAQRCAGRISETQHPQQGRRMLPAPRAEAGEPGHGQDTAEFLARLLPLPLPPSSPSRLQQLHLPTTSCYLSYFALYFYPGFLT